MTTRTCEGCRFYADSETYNYGHCRRNPPVGDGSELPQVGLKDWCGEWRDKKVTPEQEERRELVRRFAVALAGSEWASDYTWPKMWEMASSMADAESK